MLAFILLNRKIVIVYIVQEESILLHYSILIGCFDLEILISYEKKYLKKNVFLFFVSTLLLTIHFEGLCDPMHSLDYILLAIGTQEE